MTALELSGRFIGIKELSAAGQDHPMIQFAFTLCDMAPNTPDEVPWCSAFSNLIAWLLGLDRSGSAAARSWLTVGKRILIADAAAGNDVVVLKRGSGNQPGLEVLNAQGHVGFYVKHDATHVEVLAGNQGNAVSVMRFPISQVLAIQRLSLRGDDHGSLAELTSPPESAST